LHLAELAQLICVLDRVGKPLQRVQAAHWIDLGI
jgi:hypothetical protein